MRIISSIIISIFILSTVVLAEPVYTENTEYKIEVLEDGHVQVRRSDIVLKDGVEISRQYHRHVLAPADDVTKEPTRVKAVAGVVWTRDVIDDYAARKAKLLE